MAGTRSGCKPCKAYGGTGLKEYKEKIKEQQQQRSSQTPVSRRYCQPPPCPAQQTPQPEGVWWLGKRSARQGWLKSVHVLSSIIRGREAATGGDRTEGLNTATRARIIIIMAFLLLPTSGITTFTALFFVGKGFALADLHTPPRSNPLTPPLVEPGVQSCSAPQATSSRAGENGTQRGTRFCLDVMNCRGL